MPNSLGNGKRLKLSVLETSELEKIHQASLEILSETGVNIHSKEMRNLLNDAGADIKII